MRHRQGDLFWISPNESNGIASDHTHPHLILREHSLHIVDVCALTTNLKRAKEPGNVLLEIGEANLPRQSVVVVSRMTTMDKAYLGEYIGTLTEQRIDQVLVGLRFLRSMLDHHIL